MAEFRDSRSAAWKRTTCWRRLNAGPRSRDGSAHRFQRQGSRPNGERRHRGGDDEQADRAAASLRRKDVEEEYGVPPEKIVDLLSLIGDLSDNVPEFPESVPRPRRSLSEHGTLRESSTRPRRWSFWKLREGLIAGREAVLFSRTLIRLKTDVELGIEPDELAPRAPQDDLLNTLYEELEFHTLKRRGSDRVLRKLPATASSRRSTKCARLPASRRGKGIRARHQDDLRGSDARRAAGPPSVMLRGRRSIFLRTATRAIFLGPRRGTFFAPSSRASRRRSGGTTSSPISVLRRHGLDVRGVDFDTMLASRRDRRVASQPFGERSRQRPLGVRTIAISDLVGTGRSQISIVEAPSAMLRCRPRSADLSFRLRKSLEPT